MGQEKFVNKLTRRAAIVIVGGSQKRRWPVEGSKPPENT